MGVKSLLNSLIKPTGYEFHRTPQARLKSGEELPFRFDGLTSYHNHDFMQNPGFKRAYERGVAAAGIDYKWYWRVYTGLWAAQTAAKLDGDFVECGVNLGFMSSAVMELLDWDSTGKTFYLMDTFAGVDERYTTEEEREQGVMERNDHLPYTTDLERVRANFSGWQNKKIIVGAIPETLEQADTDKVAYMHIDMDCIPPEIAAINYFWDKLVPGALMVLNCYAYYGYDLHRAAYDELFASKGVRILTLPTGQGLVIKPG